MNPLPHANNAGSMRPILEEFKAALRHHELNNVHGLTVGDAFMLDTLIYMVQHSVDRLRRFQVSSNDPLVTEAVCELLDPPARFPSNDEQE
jgi:hypothetical protein